MSNYYRIEPREHYDKAILKVDKNGYITYSYKKLMKITSELYGDQCDQKEDDGGEAIFDYLHYNILGLNDNQQSHFKVIYTK